MPFRRSENLHQEVLLHPKFEPDEDYKMEEDQKDQLLVEVLQKQTHVLQTMQSTIQKFVTSLDAAKKVDQGYAETLKGCIEQEHGQLPGL